MFRLLTTYLLHPCLFYWAHLTNTPVQYGYYFFLSGTVDAKLYAQTGASSQSVQLLLRRHGYNAKAAKLNEKEYFPLTGMSYVVVKVTRGCSPYNERERSEMFARHRGRLIDLLKKYTGTIGSVTADASAADDAARKKPLERPEEK